VNAKSIPADDLYRTEWWQHDLGPVDGGTVLVIMKNPSYPDEGNHCFRQAAGWARVNGFSTLAVANLFARRAFHPRELNRLTFEEATHPHNDSQIEWMQFDADLVLAAWGQPSGIRADWYRERVGKVVEVIGRERLACLKTTSNGHPFHPQTWARSWTIRDWSVDEVARWDR
jgi:hypothetical protein